MKNKSRSWLSGSLAALLSASLAMPAVAAASQGAPEENVAGAAGANSGGAAVAAPSFSDVENHWAKEAVKAWAAQGFLNGYEDGTFHPDAPLTRAELVKVLNRVLGYPQPAGAVQPFADVQASDWYAQELATARAAGYYQGLPGNVANPNAALTREDAAVLLTRTFSLKAASDKLIFTDAAATSSYALSAVQAMAGQLQGYEDGGFRPQASISRAEAVTLLDRLAGAVLSKAGDYSDVGGGGSLLINTTGVNLKDTTVQGDLYLAPGIGSGDVVLERVTVKGRVLVSGGGEHSITVKDSTLDEVEVNRKDGKVRVHLTGSSSVQSMIVTSPSKLELEGTSKVERVEGSKPVELVVGKGSQIGELTLGDEADSSSVTGEGSIEKLKVEADGVTVNGKTVEKGEHKGSELPAANTQASTGGSTGSAGSGSGSTPTPSPTPVTVDLVDKDASAKTRSLFVYLNGLRGNSILFGQEHATTEGFTITKRDGTESDVNNGVGDFPALFGWDTLSLEGQEKPGSLSSTRQENRDALVDVMKKAYARGGVLTLSAHMPNFVNGGKYNNTAGNVVENILPGGTANAAFTDYLDMVADFAHHMKDDQGNLIPVVFRPFHENNGSWFWWGAAHATPSQYKEIFRYTVEYLRDQKGVRNFLYAYSPNAHFTEELYLKTYPGDDYVDILGFDAYGPNGDAAGWMQQVKDDAKIVSKLADARGKVAAFTEFGYTPDGFKFTGNVNKTFFTDLVDALKSDPDAKRMAYMLTWAHFNIEKLYVPVKNYNGQDSELMDDFVDFYNDPYTLFSREVQHAYTRTVLAKQNEAPSLHVVTPTELMKLSAANSTIRARVLNAAVTKVVYSVGSDTAEYPMTLDASGFFSVKWMPTDPALLGTNIPFTVKAYVTSGAVLTQTVTAKVTETVLGHMTFDTGIDGVQNNGGWQATLSGLAHERVHGDGKLRLDVEMPTATDTWQEVKLEFPNVKQQVSLADVTKVRVQVLIPTAGQLPTASLQTVVMLPPDWNNKYGMNSSAKRLNSLPTVTVNGAVYGVYTAEIDLDNPAMTAAANDLALSFVGSSMAYTGPIYVDNIQLVKAVKDLNDPLVVDTFDGYQGQNGELVSKYAMNSGGDSISLSLDATHKAAGTHGLKVDYTLGTNGYAGVTKNMGGVDWSGQNKLRFWLVPDTSSQELTIQVKANGIYFETHPIITSASWVELPFGVFAPASWDTAHAGAKLDAENRKLVQEFSIYVGSIAGFKGSGVLYFDEIRTIQDGTGDGAGAGGGNGGGNTNTPIGAGVVYDFETDTEGWSSNNNAVVLSVTQDAATVAHGAQALKAAGIPLNNDAAAANKIELLKERSMNLTGLSKVTVKVKLVYDAGAQPVGTAVHAKLYLKSGGNWDWYDSGDTGLVEGDFVTLTIDLTKVNNLDQVKSMGLELYLPASTGTGTATMYVDQIEVE